MNQLTEYGFKLKKKKVPRLKKKLSSYERFKNLNGEGQVKLI